MKNLLQLRMLLMVLLTFCIMASSAFAALPTEVTAAFTSLGSMVSDLVSAAWPILTAVLLAFGTIKLVKKFWGKSA